MKSQYVILEHKTLSLKSLGNICSNSQQYIIWVKIIHFSFMPKIISILRSCSMKIFCTFPTVNISKVNFLIVICIAKNFIWTTLKMILSVFRFFSPLDSRFSNLYLDQIVSYTNKPCIDGKLFCCINLNLEELTLIIIFLVQGHTWCVYINRGSL